MYLYSYKISIFVHVRPHNKINLAIRIVDYLGWAQFIFRIWHVDITLAIFQIMLDYLSEGFHEIHLATIMMMDYKRK